MAQPQTHSNAKSGKTKTGSNGNNTEQLRQQAEKTAEKVRDQAQTVVADAKQKGQEAADQAKDKAKAFVDQQQRLAADQSDGIARALRKTADELDQEQAWLAQGITKAAATLESTAESLRNKDINTLAGQLERYTRQQPGLVLGGAVIAGFLLARFLKSSAERQHPADSTESGGARTAGQVKTNYYS